MTFGVQFLLSFDSALPNGAASGFTWLARLLAWALDQAVRDPGIPPERAREQMARLGPALVRALEPAKLADDLRELHAAVIGLDRAHPLREQAAGLGLIEGGARGDS